MPVASWQEQIAQYAPFVLRAGLASVILWFGSSQLLDVSLWTSWVPAYATSFGLSAEKIVLFNGLFEVALGALLLLGVYTRAVAGILFLHMAILVAEFGMTPVGVRDFGLAMGLLTLALDMRKKWAIT